MHRNYTSRSKINCKLKFWVSKENVSISTLPPNVQCEPPEWTIGFRRFWAFCVPLLCVMTVIMRWYNVIMGGLVV